MKHKNLLRWIEAAEARSVCMLAEESPGWPRIAAASPAPVPIQGMLVRLREQLCLGDGTRRLARLYRTRPSD